VDRNFLARRAPTAGVSTALSAAILSANTAGQAFAQAAAELDTPAIEILLIDRD
jgi:hypothetical protein